MLIVEASIKSSRKERLLKRRECDTKMKDKKDLEETVKEGLNPALTPIEHGNTYK